MVFRPQQPVNPASVNAASPQKDRMKSSSLMRSEPPGFPSSSVFRQIYGHGLILLGGKLVKQTWIEEDVGYSWYDFHHVTGTLSRTLRGCRRTPPAPPRGRGGRGGWERARSLVHRRRARLGR